MSITRLHAQLSNAAHASRTDANEASERKLEGASKKHRDLREAVVLGEESVSAAEAGLARSQHKSTGDHIEEFFGGADDAVVAKDVVDRETADLQRAQQLLELIRSDQKSLYGEIRRSEGKANATVQAADQLLLEAEQARKA